MVGQAARDVARHFIQRWNFVGKCRKLLPLSDYPCKGLSAAAETLLRPPKYYGASGPVVGAPVDEPAVIVSHVPAEGKLVDPSREFQLPPSANENPEDDDSALNPVATATETTRESPGAAAGGRSHPASSQVTPNPNPGDSIPAADTLGQSPRNPPRATPFATPTSTCQVQVLRQSAQWSSGIAHEASVYKAWYELISEAKHFVYIENQFFVTTTGEAASGIKNQLGNAIVERIRRAYEEKTKFRIIVVMPLLPAFEAALSDPAASTVRLIVRYQYESICQGQNSIYETLKKFGINPADYIEFFGLRRWDTIVAGHQKSAEDDGLQQTDVLSIQDAQDTNTQSPGTHEAGSTPGRSSVRIRPRRSTSHMSELEASDENDEVRNQMDGERDSDSGESDAEETNHNHLIRVKVRKLRANRARAPVPTRRWKSPSRRCSRKGALLSPRWVSERGARSISKSAGFRSDVSGLGCASQQIYVHSKLLIVDDTYVVCGSGEVTTKTPGVATRSAWFNGLTCRRGYLPQKQISTTVRCAETEIPKLLCPRLGFSPVLSAALTLARRRGQFKVGRFAHSLRVHLFKEHLGLLDCQQGPDADGELAEKVVAINDPLAPEFYERLWKRQARVNTEKYREVFRCVPDDTVTTWDEYRKFTPDPNTIMTKARLSVLISELDDSAASEMSEGQFVCPKGD
ncbi:MAG: hypothetical protein BJ554DRAFT_142, partial [Olpidium bornovanus]